MFINLFSILSNCFVFSNYNHCVITIKNKLLLLLFFVKLIFFEILLSAFFNTVHLRLSGLFQSRSRLKKIQLKSMILHKNYKFFNDTALIMNTMPSLICIAKPFYSLVVNLIFFQTLSCNSKFICSVNKNVFKFSFTSFAFNIIYV